MCLWMVKGYWGHQSRLWGSLDNTWEGGWGASLIWEFREAFLAGGGGMCKIRMRHLLGEVSKG